MLQGCSGRGLRQGAIDVCRAYDCGIYREDTSRERLAGQMTGIKPILAESCPGIPVETAATGNCALQRSEQVLHHSSGPGCPDMFEYDELAARAQDSSYIPERLTNIVNGAKDKG